MNFYFPWNHEKTIGCLMISEGFDFDFFVEIFLMLEAKFGYVNLFLVDDAFLYPLKTSEKALSVPDLLNECIATIRKPGHWFAW